MQSADAFISVLFEFKENCFYLTVSNKISDKKALKKERSGIGANTLEQRLKIIYKNQFKLDKFVENDIYIAHLKINLLEYKTQMLAAGRWIAGIDVPENAVWANSGIRNRKSIQ